MSLSEFKKKVRGQHAAEFQLHHDLATLVEREVIAKPRSHPDAVAVVLDMLVIQAYKAHLSTAVVGEIGHLEDMATLARRLLELAIQSIYIGGDDAQAVRLARANLFIAYLWDNLPDKHKDKLPPALMTDWKSMADAAGERRSGRTRWGPTFADMFTYAERRDLYDQDYKFLSALAHGSSESLIFQYSRSTIRVQSTDHVGTLLVYASKYYLNVIDHWIRLYSPGLYPVLEPVAERLRNWRRDGSDARST